MRGLIIANGEFPDLQFTQTLIKTNQYEKYIAADGGVNYYLQLGIEPDILVGDFDSLDKDLLDKLIIQKTQMYCYPRNKLKIDLELAIDHAVSEGITQLDILAAMGGRWDMCFANMLLLGLDKYREINISIVDKTQQLGIIWPHREQKISGKPGDKLSLLSLFGTVSGVTTENLLYPLNEEIIEPYSSMGVSNELVTETALIKINQGRLIYIMNDDVSLKPLYNQLPSGLSQ